MKTTLTSSANLRSAYELCRYPSKLVQIYFKLTLTLFFITISNFNYAQILDLVNGPRFQNLPPRATITYPNCSDCNGHGINGGVRPCLGCTPVGPNNFPTASDWIAAKGTNIVSGNVGVAMNFIVDVPLVFDNADVRR